MKERISIALATFNGEKYLLEQLFSFQKQTRQPDELIICDDCSTDSTVAIANKFAEKAPFEVKILINGVNLGFAQNFSRALQSCSGDIVFLSDQDDVWLPSKINEMLLRFSANPEVQLLIHDLEYCKGDLTPIGQTKIQRMKATFDLNRKYVVGMATAIRGPFLKLCLPIPIVNDLSHDLWLHSCAGIINKKQIMNEVLALYRRHTSSATNAGSLNVDFVTTPGHFKFGQLKNKTFLPCAQIEHVCNWLQENKAILLERGHVSPLSINEVIKEEGRRLECTTVRAEILAMGRLKRFRAVSSLLFRGGYQRFSGWKSAIRDMFLN
jgi:glycosyltransferase involved in cell wall biosynthesis